MHSHVEALLFRAEKIKNCNLSLPEQITNDTGLYQLTGSGISG